MSTIAVNSITDASGGNTASINGATPTNDNLMGRNRIINGDMRIWQRATSVTGSTGYSSIDRYDINASTSSLNVVQSANVPSTAGFVNSVKITVGTASSASSAYAYLIQMVEGYNWADMRYGSAAAQTATLSFWVKSSVAGTYGICFRNTGAARFYTTTYTISAADTWEYKTITITGDTSGTWLTTNGIGFQVIFDFGVGTTYSTTSNNAWTTVGSNYFGVTGTTKLASTAGATFNLTGLQLEAGSVATSFERRSYGQELALCQRYCFATINSASSTGSNPPLGFGNARSSTNAYIQQKMPVTMRTSPSVTVINPTSFYLNNTSNVSTTGISLDISGLDMAQLNVSVASGLTSTLPYSFLGSNANGQLIYSAEL